MDGMLGPECCQAGSTPLGGHEYKGRGPGQGGASRRRFGAVQYADILSLVRIAEIIRENKYPDGVQALPGPG